MKPGRVATVIMHLRTTHTLRALHNPRTLGTEHTIFVLASINTLRKVHSARPFAAWSSFAHAAVMTVTAFSKGGYGGDLWGVAVLVIIGVALIDAGSAKAVRRAGIGSRCVGSHSRAPMHA
jgi:hypothetical protein